MHSNEELVKKLYNSLNGKNHQIISSCYHPDATFRDIAFDLRGKKQIHAMWHMICETDLRASFKVLHADDRSGAADVVDEYTFRDTGRPVRNEIRSEFRFRDGLIIEHRDKCNALKWGVQALGPLTGIITWLVPATRKAKAEKKLEQFIATHPEYKE